MAFEPFYNLRLGKIMFARKLVAILALGALTAPAVNAEENLWLYAKGTDTRPEGSSEFKLSSISRIGKDSGSYTFHDIRPEFEYGITNSLTIGAEVMIFDHSYSVVNPDLNPMFETQGGADQEFNKTQIGGYELALKYNVLSPYKDIIGLSFGLAYENRSKYRLDGADIDQDSFVGIIFMQKNFLDNTLQLVANTKFEFERRKSPGVLEEEIAVDASLAVSYRFMPKWFVGLEFRHQSDYLNPQEDGEFDPTLRRSSFDLSDFRVGSQHQRGNYFGPSVHYAEKNWWLTAGILWQIDGGGSVHSLSYGDRNWDEHERRHIGFSWGYEF